MNTDYNIGPVTGITASDQARLHIGHHIKNNVENHVYLHESQLSPAERSRLREDALLSSLVFDGMTDRERAVSDTCEHTFEWAFEEKLRRKDYYYEYVAGSNPLPVWLSRENGMFFITGKAGSGKSTFMRYLASHHMTRTRLQEWARSNESSLLVVSHFFWCSGRKMQSSREGLWRNLLFLVLKQYRELIPLMFSQRLQDDVLNLQYLREQSWERRDIVDALSQLPIHLYRQKLVMCLFIDGLDEFEGDESTLMAEIRHLLASPLIKICASSRPRNRFESAFGSENHQWKLALHDHTRNDIAELARSQLYGDQSFALVVQNVKHRAAFIRNIEQRAEGVFLWAVLVVREIIREIGNGGDMNDLKATLYMLPSALGGNEGLFQRIIERSDPRHRKYMARLLLLTLHLETRLHWGTRPPYPLTWRSVYFMTQEWKGIHYPNRGCLQLDDKYRKPWQYLTHLNATQRPRCCEIFLECYSGNLGSHLEGLSCDVDMKLLEEDAQRQVRRWCPDFLSTGSQAFFLEPRHESVGDSFPTPASLKLSHRSIRDYIRTSEVQKNLVALAGDDFDPALTLCDSWLALSRLQTSATTVPYESQLFLRAAVEIDNSSRDYVRSSLRLYESLHFAERAHVRSAHVIQESPGRTAAYWALQHCDSSPYGRYDLVGGCCIGTEQQYHAWFLAVLAVQGVIWYVDEEWAKIPASASQDMGSIILAALVVMRPSWQKSTDHRSALVRQLLISGVSPNSIYRWSFRSRLDQSHGHNHRRIEYDLTLWQVFIRMMPLIWAESNDHWIVWILDTMETLLVFGGIDVECTLPGKHKSLLSAMEGDATNFHWEKHGPRLQSILANHGLLTSEERTLAELSHLTTLSAAPIRRTHAFRRKDDAESNGKSLQSFSFHASDCRQTTATAFPLSSLGEASMLSTRISDPPVGTLCKSNFAFATDLGKGSAPF